MGILVSVAESVRRAVPGLTSSADRLEQVAEEIAEQHGTPVGYFRCEWCGKRKIVEELGSPRIVNTGEDNTAVMHVCLTCQSGMKGGVERPYQGKPHPRLEQRRQEGGESRTGT